MQSIDDIKNQGKFDLALLEKQTLVGLKTLQAALVDELASGKIDIATWNAKDSAYSEAIQKVQERLDAHHFNKGLQVARVAASDIPINTEVGKVVKLAVDNLSKKGAEYKSILAKTEYRLQSSYFC
ncbi:hypothetical protein [Photobacterium damselae]|uniref:hypothetical protein n=1 Tax=Photobacterium damselae TaxID=38293 RepID=UPI004068D506